MSFIDGTVLGTSESASRLMAHHVPSRIGARDASVFGDDAGAVEGRLGWATLASDPPLDPEEIAIIAQQARCEDLEAVVLIAQGGSAQAAQTITKLHSIEVPNELAFRTMDSLSPVYVHHILGASNPEKTLYIVSSKSGSTLEPILLGNVAWKYVCAHMGREAAGRRFIAITDPGSELERIARTDNWRAIFSGEPSVGGRYSALSVFGLLPMACVGMDVGRMLADAEPVERLCASDAPENPALQLASFLYESLKQGRDKFSLLMPPRNQVFGLWVEQLVAESLGKDGVGILPNVEIDAGILSDPHADRCAILCNMNNDEAFEHARTCLHPDIPVFRLDIPDSTAMMRYFLIWEYAVAFCGWLMDVNPFDQPDVESTKVAFRKILYGTDGSFETPLDAQGRPAFEEFEFVGKPYADKVYVSSSLLDTIGGSRQDVDLDLALRLLFRSLARGDYFSFNAFLPFRQTGRREALERVRHRVADRLDACSCLEIGPRYLHSTGQLHKGGPDTGVYLIVSSSEAADITVPSESFTLGDVEEAQALGDFASLASRGRRAIYVHLTSNEAKHLALFADDACSAISAAYALRAR